MKEIIKHIDGVAGRVVTITGLTETTMTRDNVLGILNGTQNEVLYVPMFYGDLQSVTYSNGTLTITLADTVPAIANGDKLFVKLYTDVDIATEATAEAAKNNASAATAAASDARGQAAALRTTVGLATDPSAETTSSPLFAWVKKIRDYLYGIVTTNPYATETNATANKEAIIAAMPTIPTDYAKQSNLGDDDDSAAETGTLFAIVKYIKNTVKSVYTSVGSALASAVAAIKGDTESIISTQSGHTTTLGNINTNMAKNDTVAKEATVNAGFAAGAKEVTVNAGTAEIEQKIGDTFVKVDFTEDGLPLTREGGMCPITDGTDVFDGDYDMYSTHETSYAVGTVIQCTADNEHDGSSNVYAFIKAGASNLGISSGNVVTGTFEFGTWKKGHYYRVAQIIEATDLNNETTVHIFTYEELPATIVEGFDQTKEAVQAAKQAIKGNDPVATLSAIYAVLSGGAVLPDGWQQQAGMILRYLGCPAAWTDPVITAATPQEIVDELETIFTTMGIEIAPCEVGSDGIISAPSES